MRRRVDKEVWVRAPHSHRRCRWSVPPTQPERGGQRSWRELVGSGLGGDAAGFESGSAPAEQGWRGAMMRTGSCGLLKGGGCMLVPLADDAMCQVSCVWMCCRMYDQATERRAPLDELRSADALEIKYALTAHRSPLDASELAMHT